MERYICIHGHFYQPPRENPWLERIEVQDSARPYHDWNERVTAESYATNAASRILDDEGRIIQIVNNYSRMSFNFGPTLLSWLEQERQEVYLAILDADRASRQRFSGHGSALAQVHNHVIMPLANRRDKRTQVLWGIRDFQRRFQRDPEGMWLPETAVDLETLDLLAEQGIAFTILSPHQAKRVRRTDGDIWGDVNGEQIDPTMPYQVRLPSGRAIAVFFYDGPISRAVAFEGLLSRGERFAGRILGAFSDARTGPQLVHIATDGETYGHHHRFGDMALAFALHYIESHGLARLTNYGEYLERHPPTREAKLYENTSWSCAHGVGRWRSDCGCNTGAHPGWSQSWRAPLRESLDWLRDALAPRYEEMASAYLHDPWAARDDYIDVVLDRSSNSIERFFAKHAVRPLTGDAQVDCLKLLELQRHAMLMFTSCGWFFDDLAGIEAVQVLQYAGRAVQLGQQLFGDHVEAQFLARLEQARSNVPEQGDGRRIYDAYVTPAKVDWERIGAHFAVSSLFDGDGQRREVYCYRAEPKDARHVDSGKAKLSLGRAAFTSAVTLESAVVSYGAMHVVDLDVRCGVSADLTEEAYASLVKEMGQAFSQADYERVTRLMERSFGESSYSLRSLFRDEQRRIVGILMESAHAEAEAGYRQVYEHYLPVVRLLAETKAPLPQAFLSASEFIVNTDLHRALDGATPDLARAQALLAQAKEYGLSLDTQGLAYQLKQTLESMMLRLAASPQDTSLLMVLLETVKLSASLPLQLDLWETQNLYYELMTGVLPRSQLQADQGDATARQWVDAFLALGAQLRFRVP